MKSINILASQPIHWIYIHFFFSLLPFHHIHCLSFSAPKRKKEGRRKNCRPQHTIAHSERNYFYAAVEMRKKHSEENCKAWRISDFPDFLCFLPPVWIFLLLFFVFCRQKEIENDESSRRRESSTQQKRTSKEINLIIRVITEVLSRDQSTISSTHSLSIFLCCRLWGFTRRRRGSRLSSENDGKSSPFFRSPTTIPFYPILLTSDGKSSLYCRERCDEILLCECQLLCWSDPLTPTETVDQSSGEVWVDKGGKSDLWRLREWQRIEIRSSNSADITFYHNYTKSSKKNIHIAKITYIFIQ